MFKEGMALVEETANYLDGDGRVESRGLTRAGSLAYATESMRLTTRLMQLASWLLLQRAVNDGEMSAEQGSLEKAKVKLNGLASSVRRDRLGRTAAAAARSHRAFDTICRTVCGASMAASTRSQRRRPKIRSSCSSGGLPRLSRAGQVAHRGTKRPR